MRMDKYLVISILAIILPIALGRVNLIFINNFLAQTGAQEVKKFFNSERESSKESLR